MMLSGQHAKWTLLSLNVMLSRVFACDSSCMILGFKIWAGFFFTSLPLKSDPYKNYMYVYFPSSTLLNSNI